MPQKDAYMMDVVHVWLSVCIKPTVEAPSTSSLDELIFWQPCFCDASAQLAGAAAGGEARGMSGKQQTPCVVFVLLSTFVPHLSQPERLGGAWVFAVNAMMRSGLEHHVFYTPFTLNFCAPSGLTEHFDIITWLLYCSSLAVCAKTWLFQGLTRLLPWTPNYVSSFVLKLA